LVAPFSDALPLLELLLKTSSSRARKKDVGCVEDMLGLRSPAKLVLDLRDREDGGRAASLAAPVGLMVLR
jgi:hypothetical protein